MHATCTGGSRREKQKIRGEKEEEEEEEEEKEEEEKKEKQRTKKTPRQSRRSETTCVASACHNSLLFAYQTGIGRLV